MSLNDDLRLFNKVPLLAALGADALRLLAFSAEKRRLSAGDTLFSIGDHADGAYLVVDGLLELSGLAAMPPKHVGTGTLVGELSLIAAAERRVNAQAVDDLTVMAIRRTEFRRVLEEYPDAAARLQGYLAQKMAETQQDLHHLARIFTN